MMLAKLNACYFSVIALFSVLYPGPGGGGWWLVPLFMLMMGSGLYWVHRLGHTLLWRPWFEAHVIGHHLQQYPSSRFSSTAYRKNLLDEYDLNTWTYAIAAVLVLLVFQQLVQPSRLALAYLLFLTCLFLYVENALHNHVHTSAPLLPQDSVLGYMYAMHRKHHATDMKCNYAVLSLWLDWLYGSLKKN